MLKSVLIKFLHLLIKTYGKGYPTAGLTQAKKDLRQLSFFPGSQNRNSFPKNGGPLGGQNPVFHLCVGGSQTYSSHRALFQNQQPHFQWALRLNLGQWCPQGIDSVHSQREPAISASTQRGASWPHPSACHSTPHML